MENPRLSNKSRKTILLLCISLEVIGLFTFKYLNAVLDALPLTSVEANAFHIEWRLPFGEDLLIPLAISYYALQAISYMIDVYQRKIEAETNPLKLLLFVTFFPQMLQGPISRYEQLSIELSNQKAFDFLNLKHGLFLMLWGYLKVMMVSTRAGDVVETVFYSNSTPYGLTVFIGLVMYGIQLYCNFSGGIDIIRGSARCFGIDMVDNFKQPFFSKSLAEFWRRWHITLGSWMRDYIFYPFTLSKPMKSLKRVFHGKVSRKTAATIAVAIGDLLVFVLVGLWHGSSSIYIAWGLYNGIIIAFNQLMENPYKRINKALHINTQTKYWQAFSTVRAFVIITIGWTFDVSSSAIQGLEQIGHMFMVWNTGALPHVGFALLFFILLVLIVDIIHERGISISKWLDSKNYFIQVLFWTILIQFLACFASLSTGGGVNVCCVLDEPSK